MMLSPSEEKCGHKVIGAIAHALKKGLSHLLVAQQKGQLLLLQSLPCMSQKPVEALFVSHSHSCLWQRRQDLNLGSGILWRKHTPGSKLGYRQIRKD